MISFFFRKKQEYATTNYCLRRKKVHANSIKTKNKVNDCASTKEKIRVKKKKKNEQDKI